MFVTMKIKIDDSSSQRRRWQLKSISQWYYVFLNKCLHCNKLFQDQHVRNQFNREKHIKSNLTTVKKTAKKALLLESTRNSTKINKMFKGKIRTFNLVYKNKFYIYLILAVTARHRSESSSSNTSEDSLGSIDAFDAAMLESPNPVVRRW